MSTLPAVGDQSVDLEQRQTPAAVVDVWGHGSAACDRLAPVQEEVAKEYSGRVKIVGLDAHENDETTSGFGVMSLPPLFFFKDGKEVGQASAR